MVHCRIASCASVAILLTATSAFATVSLDRVYLMGDFGGEGDAIGDPGPSVGEVVNSTSFFGDVLADINSFATLIQSGGPVYASVSSGPFARPGASGFGIQFDGVDDYLNTGTVLNNMANGESQGLQLWVYPTSLGLGTGRQGIVFDTNNAGGPSITADGQWTQYHSGHGNDTDIVATVPVVGDTWHHVMQHIYKNADPGGPVFVPGTGTERTFISVLYVNGVAVSANGDNNLATPEGFFLVGAEELSGTPSNFFEGVLDDLKAYTSFNNEFNLFQDNDYIATQIAQIPGGVLKMGDLTLDGDVDDDDIGAFVDGWLKEKRFDGAHNDMWVGDWETWGWGDLNQDGRVKLDDAFLLHKALQMGGGSGFDFSLLNGTAVPEPSSLALLLGSVLTIGIRRRFMSK